MTTTAAHIIFLSGDIDRAFAGATLSPEDQADDEASGRIFGLYASRDGTPSHVFQNVYRAYTSTRKWPEYAASDFAGAYMQVNRPPTRNLIEQQLWFRSVRPAYEIRASLQGLHEYWYLIHRREDAVVVNAYRKWDHLGWPLARTPFRKYILAGKRCPDGKPPAASLLKPDIPARARTVTLS